MAETLKFRINHQDAKDAKAIYDWPQMDTDETRMGNNHTKYWKPDAHCARAV
jgi:hypothetical protein